MGGAESGESGEREVGVAVKKLFSAVAGGGLWRCRCCGGAGRAVAVGLWRCARPNIAAALHQNPPSTSTSTTTIPPPMAKGKIYGYDSSGSDSSEDEPDLEFPNPDEAADEFSTAHRRKRRRTGQGAKESAALGIFGSESEDEAPAGRAGRAKKGGTRLREKGVGFVKQGELVEEEDDDDDDGGGDYPENAFAGFAGLRGNAGLGAAASKSGDWDIDEEPARPGLGGHSSMLGTPSDWNTADEEPERPRLGLGGRAFTRFTKAASGETSGASTPVSIDAHTGLGFQAPSTAPSPQPESAFEPPLGRGFVSSSAASAAYLPTMNPAPPPSSEAPQVIRPSFTQVHQPRGRGRGDKGSPTTPNVNPDSFAARMMAKMGYQPGQGLGKSGGGILNPIEVKLRPQGAGVGAVREMTPAARAEAKRARRLRGEVVSDSEEEAEKKKKTRQRGSAGSTPGGTPLRAKKKEKTKFRTADEISASARGLEVPVALKSIVDYTGKETKLLASASGVMARDPSVEDESMKIAKRARRDLESFAGEWKGLEDRKMYIEKEEKRLNVELDEQAEEIKRLQGMVEMVRDLQGLALERTSDSIEGVVSKLEMLQLEYKNEIDNHDLSEVAVGALHPLVSHFPPLSTHTHPANTAPVPSRARILVSSRRPLPLLRVLQPSPRHPPHSHPRRRRIRIRTPRLHHQIKTHHALRIHALLPLAAQDPLCHQQ